MIGALRENVVFRCGLDEPQIGSSRAASEVVSRAQIYHQSMNENQIASTKSFIDQNYRFWCTRFFLPFSMTKLIGARRASRFWVFPKSEISLQNSRSISWYRWFGGSSVVSRVSSWMYSRRLAWFPIFWAPLRCSPRVISERTQKSSSGVHLDHIAPVTLSGWHLYLRWSIISALIDFVE